MKWMKFRNGWTVVEMLAATTCSLLILAALGGFARAQTRFLDRESRRLEVRETCRRVLDMIAREVRGAGYSPVAGAFHDSGDGLAIAGRDHLELRSDLHGASASDPPDGILDADSDERIGFVLNPARGLVSEMAHGVPATDGAQTSLWNTVCQHRTGLRPRCGTWCARTGRGPDLVVEHRVPQRGLSPIRCGHSVFHNEI